MTATPALSFHVLMISHPDERIARRWFPDHAGAVPAGAFPAGCGPAWA